ncbi:hypothetical protein QQF64_002583 [Cirrhinus molitorella]|uniref:Uncharacterized protein n=1 Tax=Cirrhinus molitorella TaxID=172907 RepID=A0ABR3MQJ8_9TELE
MRTFKSGARHTAAKEFASLRALRIGLVDGDGTAFVVVSQLHKPKRSTAIRILKAQLAYGNYDCLNSNSATRPDM